MRFFRHALITLGLLIVVAAGAAYAVVRQGLAADHQPNRLEEAVATRLVRLSIPASERDAVNPDRSPDAWHAGADHFDDHCAVCHGSDGRGRTEIGPKMYPPVPDLAAPGVQQLSDGALFSIIQNGVRWTGMPAFRAEHSTEETWRLVAFVRHVPVMPPAEPSHDHPASGHHHEAAAGRTIAMDGTSFAPEALVVSVGDTIEWKNTDPFPHNITSRAGGFRSGDIDPDGTWRYHAEKAGVFPYVCTLHPGMKGVLRVK
jgi:plastocyanin